jgi:hypothetical protein
MLLEIIQEYIVYVSVFMCLCMASLTFLAFCGLAVGSGRISEQERQRGIDQ